LIEYETQCYSAENFPQTCYLLKLQLELHV
jgi:hypothetical protein